jgi:acetyl esterase
MSQSETPQAYLDPVCQAAVNEIAAMGLPPLQDLPIPKLRQIFNKLQQHTPIPGVTETHFDVLVHDTAVKTFLFKPEDCGAELLPAILYLHGGGFIIGNHETHDSICRELVLGTGFAVVFPEYSLAPEKKFPVQNEQNFAVAQYIVKNGAKHGLKTDKIAVAGDSAGGTFHSPGKPVYLQHCIKL